MGPAFSTAPRTTMPTQPSASSVKAMHCATFLVRSGNPARSPNSYCISSEHPSLRHSPQFCTNYAASLGVNPPSHHWPDPSRKADVVGRQPRKPTTGRFSASYNFIPAEYRHKPTDAASKTSLAMSAYISTSVELFPVYNFDNGPRLSKNYLYGIF